MLLKQTVSFETLEGADFIPITVWAQTALVGAELQEFDRVFSERDNWFNSLILDGTIISVSPTGASDSLNMQHREVEYIGSEFIESPAPTPHWMDAWRPFCTQWLVDTNQTRIGNIIEK